VLASFTSGNAFVIALFVMMIVVALLLPESLDGRASRGS